MELVEDGKYEATCIFALCGKSKNKGTLGIELDFTTEAGDLSKTIWFTPNNRIQAAKELKSLGVSDAQMRDLNWYKSLTGADAKFLVGAKCIVVAGTEEREINGRTVKTWRAKFINSARQRATVTDMETMSQFFGDGPAEDPSQGWDPNNYEPGF